jgi:MAGUK p55 subfamily protein 5
MPYVVFVAPPSLDKLRKWKLTQQNDPMNDDQLKDIIEKAREMENMYGQFFDMFITMSDVERAYQQLLSAINVLEREPQWVPAAWLSNTNNMDM